MWTYLDKTADLLTFIKQILNGKLHFCVFWILLILLLSPSGFSLNLIAGLSYTLHQSTIDTN